MLASALALVVALMLAGAPAATASPEGPAPPVGEAPTLLPTDPGDDPPEAPPTQVPPPVAPPPVGVPVPIPTPGIPTPVIGVPTPVPTPGTTPAGFQPYPMLFPVVGDYSYVDTFGAPRDGGRRKHKGTDIFAEKGTPVVAVAAGTVAKVAEGTTAGRYIVIDHDDGWRSYYIHLNNDTPGTDDGLGWVPVEGIAPGARVEAGTLLNWVGDSGNAEGTPPHIHFELHAPGGVVLNPYPYLLAAEGKPVPDVYALPGTAAGPAGRTSAAAVAPPPVNHFLGATLKSIDPVGHINFGGGFNADLWVNGGYAYVGSWGRIHSCPGHGVRVVDVGDPQRPALVAQFAGADEFPGTYAENVWVEDVSTPAYEGALGVVGIRLCDNSESGRYQDTFRGIALYDLRDPLAPELLSTLDTEVPSQGVHELAVSALEDGTLTVAITVLQSHLHMEGTADLRLIDITDPWLPYQIADWDFRRDAPAAIKEAVMAGREDVELHAHSVWVADDPTKLYVGHWDAGTVVLDISRPAVPTFIEATGFAPGVEGNSHSGWTTNGGDIIIENHEDFFPQADEAGGEEWGHQLIYDVSGDGPPQLLASFATENAIPGEDGELGLDGIYSVHNTVVVGSLQYVSWYSDGLRIVDLSDPSNPVEVGSFVPPPAEDEHNWWMAPNGNRKIPVVWGVHPEGNLVYVSDVNSGLWIVQYDGYPYEQAMDFVAAEEQAAAEAELPPPPTPTPAAGDGPG